MRTSDEIIEQAIEEILFGAKREQEHKKRGRPRKYHSCWSLRFYDRERNSSFALISMCIKENPLQSLEELALRLSIWKLRPVAECLRVLKQLKKTGKLGYYDESRVFRTWDGEEV